MKFTVQVVVHADDQAEAVVGEVFTVHRESLTGDTLGLQLAEAKDLLAAVQDALVAHQVSTALSAQVACPDCGVPRRHKDSRPIVMRTLFGTLSPDSPRWWHCPCLPQAARTFSPLTAILPERTTPELSYLQARLAGLVSYEISAALLGKLFPLGRPLHATALRLQVQATAQRLEDELGDERFSFIDTCQRDREELPRPDLPLVVGLDGGYVHSTTQRSRRDGWFEVIAGKAVPAQGRASCFGYVQTYDTKPKRRLFEVLKAHGMAANQQVTFLTDGGEDIRDLPLYLNPESERLLDWFHITMRITVMTNMAKSLQPPPPDPDPELSAETAAKLIGGVSEDLGRLKWFLWHGNVFNALATVEGIAIDLETLHPDGQPSKLGKAVREFDSYLRANAGRIPNYGERRRAGEAISTAFVESTVNQVISKRIWSKNSRCGGVPEGPTCCCRSAPESSTTPSPTTTGVGTPDLPTPPITRRWPHSLMGRAGPLW
jgi:hypothetical protein